MRIRYVSITVTAFCLMLAPGCWQAPSECIVIQEAFMTQSAGQDDIDSVGIWHGQDGQHWLIATAKTGNKLYIYDAATGALIFMFGQKGTGPGQFARPNGIAVTDDLVFVVERDNKRMQILHLPTMRICGMTHTHLERPYGIAVVRQAPHTYDVYITDNHGQKGIISPKQVYQYRVVRAAAGCSINLVRVFGDKDGPGALWKVESIAADSRYNRLFIADEHPDRNDIKVYTLDGIFTGQTVAAGLIKSEPEGIAIYPTSADHGYLICTDQDRTHNMFLLFDRATLAYKGTFSGMRVRNTDGIACTPLAFGPFAHGALYAVHDDGSIGAFDWDTIVARVLS